MQARLAGKAKDFFKALGPGVTTGAADDDPSGIATYSVVGAQFGTSFLWASWFTWPLMGCVQMMCARVGMVTGMGLAGAFRQKFPRWVVALIAVALLVANTINIASDSVGTFATVAALGGGACAGATVTENEPTLLNHPNPSDAPTNSRVAPAGITKVCAAPIPVPVRPSPMKNTCFNAGATVANAVPPGPPKLRSAGAGVESGWLLSRNTPTSELAGHVAPEIPFVEAVVKTKLPSGPALGGLPWKSMPPVALNVNAVPGVSVRPVTCTGDCAGAESPLQHVLPLGMPERYGFDMPGTETETDWPNTGVANNAATSAARETRDENRLRMRLPPVVDVARVVGGIA